MKGNITMLSRAAAVFVAALVLVLGALPAEASYPAVRNFTRSMHGGGTQTWAIARDSRGQMYFGNKYGLLVYDSNNWELRGVANSSTVRSLLIDGAGSRVYVGASEEFGYFTADTVTGDMRYVNLSATVPARSKPFKEIWNIFKPEGSASVWFQADRTIFRYNGNATVAIDVGDRITASAEVNGRILIATAHGGLAEVQGDEVVDIEGDGVIYGMRVCAILPYNRDVMIVTDYNGLYVMRGHAITPLPTDIDAFLMRNQVFSAACDGAGRYAFGTVSKGVVVKDFRDNSTVYSNMETGMQNNTVLSAFFAPDGNLWLGLDNGIDMVNLTNPCYLLLGESTAYGAGYMSLRVGTALYLGTNQGLYSMAWPARESPEPPALHQILRGQIWDITEIDGDVFVCSDAGIAVGRGDTFDYIHASASGDIGGAWAAEALPGHPGYVLVSSYDSFHLLRRSGAGYEHLGPVKGYNDIGGHFIIGDTGDIWIPHWLKGVYRLHIDVDGRRFDAHRFYDTASGLPDSQNLGVVMVDGRPVITCAGGYWRLSDDDRSVRPDTELNALCPTAVAPRLHVAPNGDLWCVAGNTVSYVSRRRAGIATVDSVTFSPLADHIIPGFDNFNFIDDDRVIVSMQDGFYDISVNSVSEPAPACPVFFKTFQMQGDTTLTRSPLTIRGPIEVPYNLNSLLIEAVAPEYRSDHAVVYSFYLENYDSDWSPWSQSAAKEYTRLHEGDYTMRVRALNPFTHTTDEAVLQFSVLPPWFRTGTAKTIYALLALMLLFIGYKAVAAVSLRASRKVARRKQQELDTMRHRADEEALLKDYEIAELKGRQLEQDIKHKTEELSNITMNVVRKNEILLDISGRLDKLTQGDIAPEALRQINRIKSLIRENISHDEDWRNFMHNFDAAYEDFTRNLLARHPGLTPTELRVCCYLKMGLSSKEIAPLFNISYRSVEMTRYRLRKKLALARDNSLTDYLQSIG